MNVLPSLLHFRFCHSQYPGPKLTNWRTAYCLNFGLEFGIFSVYYLLVGLEIQLFPAFLVGQLRSVQKPRKVGLFCQNKVHFLSQETCWTMVSISALSALSSHLKLFSRSMRMTALCSSKGLEELFLSSFLLHNNSVVIFVPHFAYFCYSELQRSKPCLSASVFLAEEGLV